MMNSCVSRVLLFAMALALALSDVPARAADGSIASSFATRLDADKRKEFEAYRLAMASHDSELDAYWRQVTDKRALRRSKKKQGATLTREDYVATFPPEYKGPSLSARLAKLWEEHRHKNAPSRARGKGIATVADALAAARKHYNFAPSRIPEREFKVRYAREALTLGLTKEQVLRVYALETGGQGTADMQSGINPITKQGRPISTALGYAQLLHANSVDEIDNHGDKFVARLRELAAKGGLDAARVRELGNKITALRRMIANARTVPDSWDAHVAYGTTSKGMGIHAVNLDGDIGPWLQVVKLAGLKEMAEKNGRPQLSGSEIELMNLAGPGTGLEMMQPAGRNAPTPNFFARQAYARNTVVRGRTSAELMAEMDRRMDFALTKPGAQEFTTVFDEVTGERQAKR